MLTFLRNAITRAVLPIVWSRDPDHAARTLRTFGDTESDSGWQYLQAMKYTDDVNLKRMLFGNVLEEYRHSDYFYGAAHQLAKTRLHSKPLPRTQLVKTAQDIPYFLAYAHECERSVHGQFDAFASACRLFNVSDIFRNICADEEDHEAEAYEFLSQQVESKGRVRLLVLKAKVCRLYEGWMRGSQRIGDIMSGIILIAIFFIFGPLLVRREP